jgi:drug/metabolite transporter (DMT)-like permease
MRQRLEILAAILAVAGAAFALQQGSSTDGSRLPAGVYLSIVGAVILVLASRPPGATSVTWPARIVTVLAVTVSLALGLLAVHLCGPTVLAFDCQA